MGVGSLCLALNKSKRRWQGRCPIDRRQDPRRGQFSHADSSRRGAKTPSSEIIFLPLRLGALAGDIPKSFSCVLHGNILTSLRLRVCRANSFVVKKPKNFFWPSPVLPFGCSMTGIRATAVPCVDFPRRLNYLFKSFEKSKLTRLRAAAENLINESSSGFGLAIGLEGAGQCR